MSNNQFYIPEELSKSFNDIPTERSDYYPVFKHWWNTGVDAIREDNSAIEAKRLVSGLANITTLTNDLEDQIQSRITKLRQKQEEFVNQITDESGDIPTEIVDLWQKPTVDLWVTSNNPLKY
ncbi:MAG: hypothetical protein U5K69_14605 [Balneolaceae bacterium]|nr:hypothetical protein [Balneolaceae bacterium]